MHIYVLNTFVKYVLEDINICNFMATLKKKLGIRHAQNCE